MGVCVATGVLVGSAPMATPPSEWPATVAAAPTPSVRRRFLREMGMGSDLDLLSFDCCAHGAKVQVRMFCVAVAPPVPAVNPTYAVLPPTVVGMLMGHEVVNVSDGVAVSVMVKVSVVPS